jgi:hypothetical protein
VQDLFASAQKAFAAGMGDWDLQPLETVNPAVWGRTLLGALGPETLKVRHGMCERDIIKLYGWVLQLQLHAGLPAVRSYKGMLAC